MRWNKWGPRRQLYFENLLHNKCGKSESLYRELGTLYRELGTKK